MLTKKQKEFADEYLETGNGTQAALKAYDTTDYSTGGAISSQNLKKLKIQEYLADKAERAAERIFELMNQDENLAVALGAGKDILDRGGLKPTDKTEVTIEDNTKMSYERAKQIIINGKGSDKSDSAE